MLIALKIRYLHPFHHWTNSMKMATIKPKAKLLGRFIPKYSFLRIQSSNHSAQWNCWANTQSGKRFQPKKWTNRIYFRFVHLSAQDWIRTSTSLRTLRPEHSASTNFATWAGVSCRLATFTSLWWPERVDSCLLTPHSGVANIRITDYGLRIAD
jgi:hypothetical protein